VAGFNRRDIAADQHDRPPRCRRDCALHPLSEIAAPLADRRDSADARASRRLPCPGAGIRTNRTRRWRISRRCGRCAAVPHRRRTATDTRGYATDAANSPRADSAAPKQRICRRCARSGHWPRRRAKSTSSIGGRAANSPASSYNTRLIRRPRSPYGNPRGGSARRRCVPAAAPPAPDHRERDRNSRPGHRLAATR
jgi:hypothetical protein